MLRPSLTFFVLAAAVLAKPAHADEPAPNADRRTFGTAVQRDARGNQSAAAALSLPVGRHAWVQTGVGQSRSRDEANGATAKPGQLSVGGGVAGRQWQASLNASQRRDGSKLRQTDLTAAVDWKPVDGVNVGVDAVKRRARARGAVAPANGGAPTAIEQRLDGHGLGVHGAVALTPKVSVYGAALRNKYRSTTTQQVPGAAPLAGVPLLGAARASVVNREEAALARSHQLGATWRVGERVALNGELSQDRLLDGGSLRSVQVKAAIAAGDSGWTVTPGIGRSRGPQGGSVNHGSLAASFAW